MGEHAGENTLMTQSTRSSSANLSDGCSSSSPSRGEEEETQGWEAALMRCPQGRGGAAPEGCKALAIQDPLCRPRSGSLVLTHLVNILLLPVIISSNNYKKDTPTHTPAK